MIEQSRGRFRNSGQNELAGEVYVFDSTLLVISKFQTFRIIYVLGGTCYLNVCATFPQHCSKMCVLDVQAGLFTK